MTFSNKIKNNKITLVKYVNGRKRKKYKYVCMKCENYGITTTKHSINKLGEIYFNGQLLEEVEEHFKCPKCKNKYVTGKEKACYFKTYIEDKKDKFVINIYGNSYNIFAPFKMVGDEEHLTKYDEIHDEIYNYTPYFASVSFDFLIEYVSGNHSVPVTLAPKTERVIITIDKQTKRVLFIYNGKFVVLNRGFMPYYAKHILTSLFQVLPLEVKVMMKNIFIENIHENDLLRWRINKEECLDEIEFRKLMYLSYAPNLFVFEPEFDLEHFRLDSYTFKKFKSAKKQIDIFKTFIPFITKRSIKHLKNVTIQTSFTRFGDVPSFYLGLLENPNTILNVLKLYEKNDVRVVIKTTLWIRHEKYVSFRSAKKMLDKFLAKGVLDNQYNYLAVGKINQCKYKMPRTYQILNLNRLTEDTIRNIYTYVELVEEYEKNKIIIDGNDRELKERLIEDFTKKIGKYYSVKKLHDDISKINIQLSKKYYTYNYVEEQIRYECNIGDFEFLLPKNTNNLINLATELDICVASYENRILNNDCTIIGVYKANKALLCLEIDRNNDVIQVKKHNNQILIHGNSEDDELIDAMHNFLASKNIGINTVDLAHSNIY